MISARNNVDEEGQLLSLSSSLKANNNYSAISPIKFEDLSVKLILEIFDLFWTEVNVLYRAFYDLIFHLNSILRQTKLHVTESNYSLVPQLIHSEQIKSLHIRFYRHSRREFKL